MRGGRGILCSNPALHILIKALNLRIRYGIAGRTDRIYRNDIDRAVFPTAIHIDFIQLLIILEIS